MNIPTFKSFLRKLTGQLNKPLAGADTDPTLFFSNLMALPNPDPILREMGRAEQVHHSIMLDPHILGELRSIRGSFRSHKYRLLVGQEGDPKAAAALELCSKWMSHFAPNSLVGWQELMWQMMASIFTGYRPHELVWNLAQEAHLPKELYGKYLPQVFDRPGRRFTFNADGGPLLISRDALQGAPVEPYRFVISRNMPTHDNPYGVALFSACFWAWMFKTGGWRYFVKYCERHGLPWPFAKYPVGTSDKDQADLEAALANMLENGYVIAPEGTGLELLTATASGQLPQESLITLCNREMSKALTSQAMVGEQLEVGSRAASETAKDRQDGVHDSDRDIAAESMGVIFKWVTLFNFGDGVAPPVMEFYKPTMAGKERADTYRVAANMGARPSRAAMLEELQIPEAKDDKDALLPSTKPAVPQGAPAPAEFTSADLDTLAGFSFAKAAGMTEDEAMQLAADAADQAIADHMIEPVYRMLVQYEQDGKTLAEFSADLGKIVGELDDEGLREVLDRALSYSMLRGAATQAD